MNDIAKETIASNLEQEMRQSYLDYAMSVIVGRALPDVRDGLKPVHRRVLYAMSELSNDWNKAYKKSARIVGDVIGRYHPHGDTAVYDTIVRMAQPFSLRYPLVDGQGNFGSVDGDSPAAMRYTEIRLSRLAHELLDDLDKETVDFYPNYDETETQPAVLPARFPNLLVNGSSGIAVGMATNIPPHNLSETIEACLLLIREPDASIDQLMEILPGPDFPTAAIINGHSGIRQAYESGRGRVHIRARVDIEEKNEGQRSSLVVTELPYQVNKARLLEKIAELVKEGKVSGISGLRDESDKSGMRMVIELKRGEVPAIVLNNLYQHTQLQTVFGINLVGLSNNLPKLFSLKELLASFLQHRREVVTRRTIFNLRKTRARTHALEGLAVALANIDQVIEMIKAAPDPTVARNQLISTLWDAALVSELTSLGDSRISRPEDMDPEKGLGEDGYQLTQAQAQSILDLRLHRLTGLEKEKIKSEYQNNLLVIRDLLDILEQPNRLVAVVESELKEIMDNYGDNRRTEILATHLDLNEEDLIVREEMVVTLSGEGYSKAQPLSDYQAQRRGGKGRVATRTKQDDFVKSMFVANSHDTILCFSNYGKVYWLRVYQLPQAGRQARGRPLVNLLPLGSQERITAFLPMGRGRQEKFVFMSTADGIVKKCSLESFSRPRPSGLRAITLSEGDELVSAGMTQGNSDLLLFSCSGKSIRFAETDVRVMGRTARGVKGIALKPDQRLISMLVVDQNELDKTVLTATARGYGKRTVVNAFPRKRRGGQGVIAIQNGSRNGSLIGAVLTSSEDELMLLTDGGRLVRTNVDGISELGRNTQGVRLITLADSEDLISLGLVVDSTGSEPDVET
ncbi:MAG: DNA gyrase subunit A [Pseudomonadota bacterium]|nr:DNA gyrase subunit A [Arenicellales bacterium]MEC8888123.1 DNA gyrase subunit A [Pseudomonadota bacterium]